MTLTERAASLFGEIAVAVAAGVHESDTRHKPMYVMLTKDQADCLLAYYDTTKPLCSSSVINRQIARDRLMMVSGLEVHLIRGSGELRVG